MTPKKTILIADDDRDFCRAISMRCKQLGLNVIVEGDAMKALNAIDETHPDLVCLDVNMPSGNGISVAEMMSTNSELARTPIIITTGDNDREIETHCHRLAIYYVPKCNDTWARIEPLIQSLLMTEKKDEVAAFPGPSDSIDQLFSSLGWEATLADLPHEEQGLTKASRSWVLSIDDDSDFSFSMKLRLAEHGIDLVRAFEGLEGFRYAFATLAHAIVLDYEMPDVNGDYVLRKLKDNRMTRNIPVIVLTGHADEALKKNMLNLGATAFLTKPIRWEKLWKELRRHITLAEPALSEGESGSLRSHSPPDSQSKRPRVFETLESNGTIR